MVLKRAESEIKTMLADTILAMCSSTLDFNSEISVEGMLGVTIDKQDVILVQINKRMSMGKHKVISTSTPHPSKKHKLQRKRVSDDDLTTFGKRKRKMSWKMRQSMSVTPWGEDDHAYTSQPEKNRKKKRKTAAELGITALTSSDSEEDIPGFDDTAHDSDVDLSHGLDDLPEFQPDSTGNTTGNTTRTPNKDRPDPRPSTSHDADLIEGLSVANLEHQLNSTAEDVLQGAQEVVGEVVETEDGQLVIKLGEMNPPLVNPHGIEQKAPKGGVLSTYWRCSVRASTQQRLNGGLCCGASVIERYGIFKRGEAPHCHPPKEDLHARILIGKMVREKARMLENLSIPSSHIFHEAVMAVIAEDPSVTYDSIAKYKTLFERRFNRARKECISSKTKIPNIGIRHLVRATKQHIREEQKTIKKQAQQQQADQPLSEQHVQEQPLQEQQLQQVQTQHIEIQPPSQHIQIQPQRVQIIVTQNT